VPFHVEDEWVVPMSKLPAIRATWYPREEKVVRESTMPDQDQVMSEKWSFHGKTYTVFIGNLGTRGSKGVNPEQNKLSWFRCFFCDVSGNQTFEALKNNEDWQPGLSALQSLPWLKTNGYYSVRNFLIIKENT